LCIWHRGGRLCYSCRGVDLNDNREVVARLRRQFVDALSNENTPETMLMYSVLIVYSRQTQQIVHAPFKCIGRLLRCLRHQMDTSAISSSVITTLTQFHQLTTRSVQIPSFVLFWDIR
jgi:hypothetical protein